MLNCSVVSDSLHVWLRVSVMSDSWTVAHHAPLSMGFSRQEYWSGWPCPPLGDLPNPGMNPGVLHCRQILYLLSHQGGPRIPEWVAYPFSRGSSQARNWTGVSWIASGFFYQLSHQGSPGRVTIGDYKFLYLSGWKCVSLGTKHKQQIGLRSSGIFLNPEKHLWLHADFGVWKEK